LVELLVVVTLLALLVAILVPSVNRAREYAYSAQCRSNLRQLWSLLQDSDSGTSLALPPVPFWQSFVRERGAGDTQFCPKDRYHEPGIEDLDGMYFVQNGRTFCYLPDLLAGTVQDGQMRFRKHSDALYEVGYYAGAYACGMCFIRLGDPVEIEVPDHLSHEEATGGCGSHHYVCYDGDADGYADWETDDFVIKMKGTVDDPGNPPGKPGKAYLSVAGSGSYAMNAAVPSRPKRPDQIMLLDYEKSIAKVLETGGQVDDFDQFLEPALRHLGKANVIHVDGSVRSAAREELEWERDRSAGRWGS